jgi:haloalkane dehalogenase
LTMRTIHKGYVDTPWCQVHYRTAGVRQPGQLPLVLLHQTASSSIMFEPMMERLADRFFMFAPDTPGFGGTDALADKGSIARYAEVLRHAMARFEIDRCWLFGHHSGASIAVQLAHDHPQTVAKLALSGPPYLTKAQIEKLVPSVCPVRLESDGGHFRAVWDRIRAKDPDAPVELTHREAVLNLWAGTRYPEAYHAVFEHDFAGQLAALECPTLVMAGATDTIRASLEPAYRVLRRGRMLAFEVGGTYICDREPGIVADALVDFFLEDDHG